MGLFDWMFKKKKEPDLLPPINRVPVDPEFAAVFAEYEKKAPQEKLALCLEGGGAKGKHQGGFLVRLGEIGFLKHVNVIAGTSVGGLNALITARYMGESADMKAVEDVWRGVNKNSAVYLGEVPNSFSSIAKALISGKLTGESLLDVTPLRNLVHRHLGNYTEFRVPTFVVATSYTGKNEVILGPGTEAVNMALATSAVPGAFPAHLDQFMDGGCVQNCPYPFLIESQKATKIVVLYCDPDPSKMPIHTAKPTTINTGTAALASLFSVQSNLAFNTLEMISELRRLKGMDPIEIAHFYPSVPTGTLLDFGGNNDMLQRGYDDAVQFVTPAKLREFLLA